MHCLHGTRKHLPAPVCDDSHGDCNGQKSPSLPSIRAGGPRGQGTPQTSHQTNQVGKPQMAGLAQGLLLLPNLRDKDCGCSADMRLVADTPSPTPVAQMHGCGHSHQVCG